MRWNRIAGGVAALAVLVGGLSGCGDDDKEPVALTVKATSANDLFSFDLPKEIDGGLVALTLDNVDSVPHEIALAKVPEDISSDKVVRELLESEDGAPIPDYISDFAGVSTIGPGEKATATQEITEGKYVYFCTFGDEGSEHYRLGMIGTVAVKGDKGGGDLPAATESITASEYEFDVTGLEAGTHKLLFKNDGDEIHHALLFPVAEGATFDEAKAFMESNAAPTGPPPVDFDGGVGTIVLNSDQEQVVDLTLHKGTYVLLCFLNDKAGGPPHVTKGMLQEVVIE